MKINLLPILLAFVLTAPAWSADYRVQPLKEAPPVDELNDEIAEKLSAEGVRVIRGSKTTYCDIWLCKSWDTKADFEPTANVLYPFQPGQLIGVARFGRKGADFRDQDIDDGVYTMRYGMQPVDGSHIGTSPTRDFLLLIRAEDEQSAAPPGDDELIERSAKAAQSTHPCLLAMQRRNAEEFPSIRHRDDFDWWILALEGTANGKSLPIEFVISGAAIE